MTIDDSSAPGVPVALPEPAVRERDAIRLPGMPMLGLGLLLTAGGVALGIAGAVIDVGSIVVAAVIAAVAGLVILAGLVAVSPGEARVLQFLGRYTGTLRPTGLQWTNPFTTKQKVSTR